MHNKSCGNGSKNCVAFRNVMRNGIAIGNPNCMDLLTPITGESAMGLTVIGNTAPMCNSKYGL